MKLPRKSDSGPFRRQLIADIRRVRAQCRREDTTALGVRCLFNHLHFSAIPDAPRGPNAAWCIMEEIRAVAPAFGGFILPD